MFLSNGKNHKRFLHIKNTSMQSSQEVFFNGEQGMEKYKRQLWRKTRGQKKWPREFDQGLTNEPLTPEEKYNNERWQWARQKAYLTFNRFLNMFKQSF